MVSKATTERLIQELERVAPDNEHFRHGYTGGDIGHGVRYGFQPGHLVIYGRKAASAFMCAAIIRYSELVGKQVDDWIHATDVGFSDGPARKPREQGSAWAENCYEHVVREHDRLTVRHEDGTESNLQDAPLPTNLDKQLAQLRQTSGMTRSRKQRNK